MEISIDKLWEYACNGDIKRLKKYFSSKEKILNRRCYRFGTEHSLIMGAFRNRQLLTVEYLLSIGESITQREREEVDRELKGFELLEKILEET